MCPRNEGTKRLKSQGTFSSGCVPAEKGRGLRCTNTSSYRVPACGVSSLNEIINPNYIGVGPFGQPLHGKSSLSPDQQLTAWSYDQPPKDSSLGPGRGEGPPTPPSQPPLSPKKFSSSTANRGPCPRMQEARLVSSELCFPAHKCPLGAPKGSVLERAELYVVGSAPYYGFYLSRQLVQLDFKPRGGVPRRTSYKIAFTIAGRW